MARVAKISTPAVDRAAKLGSAVLAGRDIWATVVPETANIIMQAGVAAFAERGFHGTNLKGITEGTGLSTAALYVHYKSKEDLLFEISKRGYAETEDLALEAMEPPDPADALRTLLYVLTRWHAQNHTIARVIFHEHQALSAEHVAELEEIRRPGYIRIRALLEKVAKGSIPGRDLDGLFAAYLSLPADISRWYGPGVPHTPDQLGRLYCLLGARMLGLADSD